MLPRCGSDIRWRLLIASALAVAVVAAALPALAQNRGQGRYRYGRVSFPPPGPKQGREFYFTRGQYSSRGRGGWYGGGGSWSTDWPEADRFFLMGVKRYTNADAYEADNVVRLNDPQLRRYPFLYMLEVGDMALTEAEAAGLRSYLAAGGFLVIDDFWGSRQWANFEREIRRVLPGRQIVQLPPEHPVFHIFYDIEEIIQVPNVRQGSGGPTYEQDGYVPYCLGIFDDAGRLMVVINWNTDLGDAWEHADDPYYLVKYWTFAWEMGINFMYYAMSH